MLGLFTDNKPEIQNAIKLAINKEMINLARIEEDFKNLTKSGDVEKYDLIEKWIEEVK